ERLVTLPTRVLRELRSVDIVFVPRIQARRSGGGLLGLDGFEAGDVLAQGAEQVGLLDLTGLLAQAQLEQLLAGLVELGVDLGDREVADFLGFHCKGSLGCGLQAAAPSRTMKRHLKGSLASARRKASLAMVWGTPASSKRTAPGLIWAT